jgi:hypothetical protein
MPMPVGALLREAIGAMLVFSWRRLYQNFCSLYAAKRALPNPCSGVCHVRSNRRLSFVEKNR